MKIQILSLIHILVECLGKFAVVMRLSKRQSYFSAIVKPNYNHSLLILYRCKQTNERISSNHADLNLSRAEQQTCSLSNDNVVLSGTQLKNTEKVFAVCVYSGPETKVKYEKILHFRKDLDYSITSLEIVYQTSISTFIP